MAVGPLMIAKHHTEAEFYRGPGQYMEVWREHLIANMGKMNLFSSMADLVPINIL